MPVVSEESVRIAVNKMLGDFSDEAPEAGYRLGATLLVRELKPEVLKPQVKPGADDGKNLIGLLENEQVGDALFGFVLAAVLELLPTDKLSDGRKRLAYNLRVRSYEEIGDMWVIPLIERLRAMWPVVDAKAEKYVRLAKSLAREKWALTADKGSRTTDDYSAPYDGEVPSAAGAPREESLRADVDAGRKDDNTASKPAKATKAEGVKGSPR